MAIIISRYNQGKPIREEDMKKLSLTDNPIVDKTLNQVMMRINNERRNHHKEYADSRKGSV